MRYITLDNDYKVIAWRIGDEIAPGEIESAAGEIGETMLPDGTFAVIIPPEPAPSQLDILQATVDQLVLDSLGV